MTEDEAQAWLISTFYVSRETLETLHAFIRFLQNEAQSQNLIAASTWDHIWSRHIVDSAQLLKLSGEQGDGKNWLDLGSGAGFPGLIVALLSQYHVTLVESRTQRIEYLHRAVALLDLDKSVTIAGMPVERLKTAEYDIISARAFAPFPKLLHLAERFSTKNTLWLLPKGRNAVKELKDVNANWALDMHIRPSVTDNEAGIIVGYLNNKRG